MNLSENQKTHEALIESAYQGLISATTRDERIAFNRQLVRLVQDRDAQVASRLERDRLMRVGL